MTTFEIEAEVHAALVGNFGDMAIYHYAAPTVEPSRYPIIVYSPVEDIPALAGDDSEFARRVTIRIFVIAALKRFDADKQRFIAACNALPDIMETLGFVRLKTTPSREDGKITYTFEFVKNELC